MNNKGKMTMAKENNINIKDIYDNIAVYLDEDKAYIERIGKILFAQLLKEAMTGKRIRIPRFGFFSLKKHKSRKCPLQETKVEEFAKLSFESCSDIKREITDKFRTGEAKAYK